MHDVLRSTFLLLVSLRVRRYVQRTLLSLPLLLSLELAIVNDDSSIHILIECLVVLVDLNEFVLNVVLKTVVKSLLKGVGSLLDLKRELPEAQGVVDSRLSLAEAVKVCLRPSPLIVDSKDLSKGVLEVDETLKDATSLGLLLVLSFLKEIALSRLEPL